MSRQVADIRGPMLSQNWEAMHRVLNNNVVFSWSKFLVDDVILEFTNSLSLLAS